MNRVRVSGGYAQTMRFFIKPLRRRQGGKASFSPFTSSSSSTSSDSALSKLKRRATIGGFLSSPSKTNGANGTDGANGAYAVGAGGAGGGEGKYEGEGEGDFVHIPSSTSEGESERVPTLVTVRFAVSNTHVSIFGPFWKRRIGAYRQAKDRRSDSEVFEMLPVEGAESCFTLRHVRI